MAKRKAIVEKNVEKAVVVEDELKTLKVRFIHTFISAEKIYARGNVYTICGDDIKRFRNDYEVIE